MSPQAIVISFGALKLNAKELIQVRLRTVLLTRRQNCNTTRTQKTNIKLNLSDWSRKFAFVFSVLVCALIDFGSASPKLVSAKVRKSEAAETNESLPVL